MMFAPISTNPLHQKNKKDDPLFFFEHDDGEPDYQNIQNHVSGETPRKSSFKSQSPTFTPTPSNTLRWASPLSDIRLIPPRPTIISSEETHSINNMLSQLSHLDLEPTHTKNNSPINESPTGPPPTLPRVTPLRLLDIAKDLVILQMSRRSPVHPRWDAIMRNNLRHLPAAQQTSSFIRTDDAATLLYPSFPKIPVRTLKDGQEIWRGNASILFEDEMENSEGSAQPVDIAIGSSRSISDKSRKGKSPAQPTKLLPLERKARKGPGPSQSENRETNQDGGAKSATGLKRRWFDTGRSLAALQNDVSRTDNDITTPGETSQLTYDADGAPAAKRRREDGSSAAPYLGEEKDTGHTFGDDIGDAKGQENDRDGDNEETVDETDLEQVSAIKHLHMILLAQARSWRSCLRTLKELEDKPNATRYKMLLERQFQEIDDHKEILTKEVLQQSELAKAIRMFAHKTVYGSAVRDTARSLLDFFGRRHVGKPLRETSTVS